MIQPVSPVTEVRLDSKKLPPDDAAFYNSKQFMSNELGFLSSLMQGGERAVLKSLHEIKAAMDGTGS
jgi:hypothetical protein